MSGRSGGTKQVPPIPCAGWTRLCMDTPIRVGSGRHIVIQRYRNLDLRPSPSGRVFTFTVSL
eukprot:10039893-Alexandrium_andersonii.AAC.1